MRSYGQYCPVAKGAELLGDRWTLLIVRELLFGPLGFNEIERGLPGISRSVLAERLRRMQHDGIVQRTEFGYAFTAAGEELRPVVQSIGEWVARWIMDEPSKAELDPELLMIWISRHVRKEALPAKRIVVEFRFVDFRGRRTWLLLEPNDISVCLEYPGFESDLVVSSTTKSLYRVYIGRTTYERAYQSGELTLDGPPSLVRAFPRWMTWSTFAPASQARVTLAATAS
jgi:DNA-binding HxlR family transcriptional regulator